MRIFKHSLIFNLSIAIIIVECLVLTSIGLFYTERFFTELEHQVEAQACLPGKLMNHQLLRYESISDLEVMINLVGEDFQDGMVIGGDGRVYYALDQSLLGKSIRDIPFSDEALLRNLQSDSLSIICNDATITTITPIRAYEGARPFFYVYIKASTTHMQQEKLRIALLFIFGSVICILLTSIAIIGYTRRRVTLPLNELQRGADALRRGQKNVEFATCRKDEIGKLGYSFTVMRDAIEQKIHELEEANLDSSKREHRLAALIEAMPDLLFILDEEGRYEDVFAAEEHLLYKDIMSLKGQLLHEVMPKEHADKFISVIHASIKTGKVQSLEYQLPVKAGNIWFEARVAPITSDTDISTSIWIVRDVTYRKQMEDRLRLAKEEAEHVNNRLRELDQTKSTLVSSVSHELRTPLTSLLGFSKLILKNFSTHFWPLAKGNHKLLTKGSQIVENLNILILEGNRLTRLINDVLDLNKIEMGYTEWHEKTIAPGDLIHKAAKAAAGQFDENPDVTLLTDIAKDLPNIDVDPDKMLQVLLNLLSNAAKFTHEGSVTLAVIQREQGVLRFSVADTGPGIPYDEHKRIFDVFHQARHIGPADDKPQGAGLGLTICRDIIHHYNGTIWVESNPGEGATFLFEIPVRR